MLTRSYKRVRHPLRASFVEMCDDDEYSTDLVQYRNSIGVWHSKEYITFDELDRGIERIAFVDCSISINCRAGMVKVECFVRSHPAVPATFVTFQTIEKPSKPHEDHAGMMVRSSIINDQAAIIKQIKSNGYSSDRYELHSIEIVTKPDDHI